MSLPTYRLRRRHADDPRRLIGTRADDVAPTLYEPGLYLDEETGEPLLLYTPPPPGIENLREATLVAPRNRVLRYSGLHYRAAAFGWRPRAVTKKGQDACHAASMARTGPDQHAVLVALGVSIEETFRTAVPERYRADQEAIADVRPDWRLTPGSPWTSGVLNYNAVLPFHRDRANYPTWSGMFVIRRHARGGHLVLPDYETVVACRDGYVVYFDGKSLTHGVTPMRFLRDDGYRISGVYFTMREMRRCLDFAEEQERGARTRTERETSDRLADEERRLHTKYWT